MDLAEILHRDGGLSRGLPGRQKCGFLKLTVVDSASLWQPLFHMRSLDGSTHLLLSANLGYTNGIIIIIIIIIWRNARCALPALTHVGDANCLYLPLSLYNTWPSHHHLYIPHVTAISIYSSWPSTMCVSRTYKLTVFVVHWKHFCLNSTRHIERITGVIFATMRYISGQFKFTFTSGWWVKLTSFCALKNSHINTYIAVYIYNKATWH